MNTNIWRDFLRNLNQCTFKIVTVAVSISKAKVKAKADRFGGNKYIRWRLVYKCSDGKVASET